MADNSQQLRNPIQVSNLCHYLPSQESNPKGCSPDDPQLIFIFGWASAELSHLLRYSRQYQAMFPAAAQLIIQCDLTAMALGSTETNVRRQRPILEQLEKLGLFTKNPPRMLIHLLSSGGAAQFHWLALAIDRMPPPPKDAHLPPTCIILDSIPTTFDLANFRRGFAGRFSGPTKLAAIVIATALCIAAQLSAAVSLRPELTTLIHCGLNNPRLVPWVTAATPRLYLYSDVDTLARAPDVRAHMNSARAAGLNVRAVRFEKSAHVLHARVYPEKYWAAVAAQWRDVASARAKL
ncbi:hypothetical protein GGX14DRAFT_571171 [Mycena pura]|uniref:DUF829-domain-containing protein n=1 Tax=Mycena pura TaxID=153505 RepID=A0AAD6V7U5_9AGAR|nr:hypothetical protein GGX14DRAFT_571171 [Mycena pura]